MTGWLTQWLTQPWTLDGLAALWLLLGIALMGWGWWGSRRFNTPTCPQCGYDLRGQPPERVLLCPECGHAAQNREQVFRRRYAPLKRWLALTLGLILFIAPSITVLYVVIGWQREQAIFATVQAAIQARDPGAYLHSSSRLSGPDWFFACLPTSLSLYGARIYDVSGAEDSDLIHLSGLKSLESLTLYGTQVTDAGLAHLSGMNALKKLKLERTKVTDAGLIHLSRLKSLKSLWLDNTQVTDTGLAYLSGMNSLESLWLINTRVTDAGLVHLSRMKSLKWLGVLYTPITDAGLVHLSGFKSLKAIYLHETQVTDAGVAAFQKQLPNVYIRY